MQPEILLDVLVLSEDSGKDGAEVLKAVMRKALAHVFPGDTRRMSFTPADDSTAHWVHAARWKSEAPVGRGQAGQHHRDLRDLVRTIATWLLKRNPLGMVAFHYDGDTVWSCRANAKTPAQFQAIIKPKIETLLADPTQGAPRREKVPTSSGLQGDALAAALARLVEVVPHYSMEAWLCLNAAELRRLASVDAVPLDVHTKLADWTSEPGSLQEIHKIKDDGWPHDKHNLSLAKNAWSAIHASEHSDSFADLVTKLSNLNDVRAVLTPPPAPPE